VGSVPRGVAVDPKTSTIYVANLDSDTVSVLAA
jgi:DNA-binding beta-propeller fold protein YncE